MGGYPHGDGCVGGGGEGREQRTVCATGGSEADLEALGFKIGNGSLCTRKSGVVSMYSLRKAQALVDVSGRCGGVEVGGEVWVAMGVKPLPTRLFH